MLISSCSAGCRGRCCSHSPFVLWLTVVELLEWRPHYAWWVWWLLLVFMTNFVGYLFLRAFRVYQRYQLKRS